MFDSVVFDKCCLTVIKLSTLKGPLLESNSIFAKIASLQGAVTFIAIIASPLAIFATIANFAKIASLQGATFGIQFKSPEAGDFSPVSPLHAFLGISDTFRNRIIIDMLVLRT